MAKVTMTNNVNSDVWVSFPIERANNSTLNIVLDTFNGLVDIDWGDGIIETNQPVNQNLSHIYSSDIIGVLRLRGTQGLQSFKKIAFNSYDGKLTGNTTILNSLSNLEEYICLSYDADFIGNINELNKSLKVFNVSRFSLIGGIADFPVSLEKLILGTNIETNNTLISGLISELPINLKTLEISTLARVDLNGDIANLPSELTDFFYSSNYGNFSGNILNLPSNLITFNILRAQSAVLTGDIANLPSGLITFRLGLTNNLFGNINTLSASIQSFTMEDVVTVNTTITGDLKDLSFDYFVLNSPNITYSTGIVVSASSTLYLKLVHADTPVLTSQNLDQLLIDLNGQIFNKQNSYIIINGVNSPIRTSNSDAAYNALVAAGVNLQLN